MLCCLSWQPAQAQAASARVVTKQPRCVCWARWLPSGARLHRVPAQVGIHALYMTVHSCMTLMSHIHLQRLNLCITAYVDTGLAFHQHVAESIPNIQEAFM